MGTWHISGIEIESWKNDLWLKVKPHLIKEAIVDENRKIKWHEQEPCIDDLSKFVTFYIRRAKRSVLLQYVTNDTLTSWRDKQIDLYIHMYSNSIDSAAMFSNLEKLLLNPEERDRAGA